MTTTTTTTKNNHIANMNLSAIVNPAADANSTADTSATASASSTINGNRPPYVPPKIKNHTSMAAQPNPQYRLYGHWNSTCSTRVRIAFELKELPFESISIDEPNHARRSEEYFRINPQGLLPALEHNGKIITQSLAILEYLEEQSRETVPLMPLEDDLWGRAHVRSLACIIACDTQPVTNDRIMSQIIGLGGIEKGEEYATWLVGEAFAAYEKLAAPHAGIWSYGDHCTIADICLIPAVWQAKALKIDIRQFPTIKRVYDETTVWKHFWRAYPRRQADCPKKLQNWYRAKGLPTGWSEIHYAAEDLKAHWDFERFMEAFHIEKQARLRRKAEYEHRDP